MKLRKGDPWMPAGEYGRSLRGLSVNLLVRDMARALRFQCEVLAAEVVYADPDFAVVRGGGNGSGEWMLHADHTYLDHPLHGFVAGTEGRGAGIELRVHGRDPDDAVAAARATGFTVLAEAADKPHGLREAHILDDDGYTWVADVPLGKT